MKTHLATGLLALSTSISMAQDLGGYSRSLQAIDSTSYMAILTNTYKKSTPESADRITLLDTRAGSTRAVELPDPVNIYSVSANNPGRSHGDRYLVIRAQKGKNKHGKVTWNTSRTLYIAELEGGPAFQVSPDGVSVHDWEIQPRTNKLVLTGTKDTNNNGKLDNDDDIVVLLYDLDGSGPAQEISIVPPK